MEIIDLRSDTVTRPSAGMRAAMAAAEVGDDQYGEDPSINRLQERVAGMLGTESAVWMPTGTMADQVALRVLTRPGDDVILAPGAHVKWHESGASAANAGVQFTEVGSAGVFDAHALAATINPRGHQIYPPSTLVVIENTHNRAGGVVVPHSTVLAVTEVARANGLATFLDGARLWNAAVASGRSVAELAAPFDLVAVSLSKGLGAPGGSILAGPRERMADVVRYRRMSGGAMRQVGIFAAAAEYALDHNLDRLAEDHANAALLAERLGTTAETNIVLIEVAADGPDAPTVAAGAREAGVLLNAFTPRLLRAVTHLDVTADQCRRAADVLATLLHP